jgi:hypothetical protein
MTTNPPSTAIRTGLSLRMLQLAAATTALEGYRAWGLP